ncbi:hypothetical protein [Streptomyces sp. NPDC059063]|uniref:hypothetical protein n=1 Tax=unclassified Streptomyces TaxID=2593676 RepID=UPI0036BA18BB
MTVTITDRNRWHLRTVRALADLAESALKAQRHPLDWTVTDGGQLVGKVSLCSGLSQADRRSLFEEWAHVLDATPPSETKPYDGAVRLTAAFSLPTGYDTVRGTIQAVFDVAGEE